MVAEKVGEEYDMRMENNIEKVPEPVLSKEEVMEFLGQFAEKGTVVRELSDESGLYLLEVQVAGEKEGEKTEYEYTRKGSHPNGTKATMTCISVAYYEDGIPVGGSGFADYNPETKEWVKQG